MGVKKSMRKLLSEPTEMRLEEIIRILEFFDYELKRVSGSHYQFSKAGCDIVTIAVHQNKVVEFYLKIVKKCLIKEIANF